MQIRLTPGLQQYLQTVFCTLPIPLIFPIMQEAIRSTRDGETITWEFPTRDLSSLKSLGWAGVGFGSFGVLFMATWMGMPLWWGVQALNGGQWFGLAFILFAALGVTGMRHALTMFRGGLGVLRNQTHCIVELSATQLKVCELLGGAKLKRKIEVDNIELLILGDLKEVDDSYRAGWMPGASDLECLSAKLKRMKSTQKGLFPIVIGYPTDILQQFGEELVSETRDRQSTLQMDDAPTVGLIHRIRDGEIAETDKPKVRLVRGEEIEEVARQQPEDSDIVVRDEEGTLAFQVPPTGIWKGSHGLFFFSIVWLLFMTVFSAGFLFGKPNGNAGAKDWDWLLGLGMTGLFWLVGIVMLIFAIHLGKRSLMIGVMDDMLFVERKSIFGKRWIQYQLDELDAIEVGPSGIEVNDVPVNELQLIPREGKTIGILSQRDDFELHWLAARLGAATGVDQRNSESWQRLLDEPEDLDKITVANVTVRPLADGCEIRVDSIGYRKMIGSVVMCSLFVAIGIAVSFFSVKGGLGGFGAIINNLFPFVFGLIFSGVSFGILLLLMVSCSRNFLIEARENGLAVERFGLLSRRSFLWQINEIKAVSRTNSGAKVNNRQLDELQIRVNGNTGLKMMVGRERSEIDFVVAHIHRAMPDLRRPSGKQESGMSETKR